MASVTVPVFSSTVPALACAMLPTNAGSWNRTGPAGACPLSVSVTEFPLDRMAKMPHQQRERHDYRHAVPLAEVLVENVGH